VKHGSIFPFVDYVDRCGVAVGCFCLLIISHFSLWNGFLLTRRDVSWFRFQGQSELSFYNPSDFQMAIEEAFLAERGFTEKLIADINTAATSNGYDDSILKAVQEVTRSNHYAGYRFLNQVSQLQGFFFFCQQFGNRMADWLLNFCCIVFRTLV